MNSELSKYINIDKLKKIINYVHKEFKVPCWIIDNSGMIVVSTGFSEICSKFHLANMNTSSNCQKCHEHIIAELKSYNILYKKPTGVLHKCENGLFEIGAPIIIDKKYIATIIVGQIFVESMDKEYFKKQAAEFSFEEKEYIKAANKVRIISNEKVDIAIDMLINLVNLIKGSAFRIDRRKDTASLNKDIVGKFELKNDKLEKTKNIKRKEVINREDIIEGLEKNEFMIIYQPVINALTYEIKSVEAYVRWNSPKFGVLSPGKFISAAKKYNLMSEIDKWMLKNVCVQNSIWSYLEYKPINVSLNISESTLRDESFFDIINYYIVDRDDNINNIQIEFSESEINDDFENVMKNLNRLKELGIKIVIDDFGKNYSFVKYIDELDIDVIKLDRSFIDGIKNSKNRKMIFKHIIDLAHANNILVVAKGVERTEIFDFLRFHKCDFIQGYVFSREVYPERLDDILNIGVIKGALNLNNC